jgi:hypothetical protein
MLLQEVYRSGTEVPSTLAADFAFAGRLGGDTARDEREIEEVGVSWSWRLLRALNAQRRPDVEMRIAATPSSRVFRSPTYRP